MMDYQGRYPMSDSSRLEMYPVRTIPLLYALIRDQWDHGE